jgi:pescadillo protein
VSKSATPSTTFYYTKDIQYLLHEPLLAKFRDHKALAKKIGRALGRGEAGDAARMEKNLTPKMTLDHIIKERYPTFIDALRDLDDALSMLFLFANLPSTSAVSPKMIALCQRLCLEFEHYLIISHSLKKSFLSIKGIYYQATIQGQDILWLVPYKFVQNVTGDIDFRIMGTFVEFYTTLLGFINFRLYTSVGLVYPPKFNAGSDERGGELAAFILEGKGLDSAQSSVDDALNANGDAPKAITSAAAQAEADKIADLAAMEDENEESSSLVVADGEEEATDAIDTFEVTGQDADILPQPQASTVETSTLFSEFTVYLSRETPRQPLEFLLKAFGCKRVGWDSILGDGAFTTNKSDPAITHQIVDRPALPRESLPAAPDAAPATGEDGTEVKPTASWPRATVPGRTYMQPQWVWDCVNQGKLLRPDLYSPGATLPPHLSPWVKPKKGQYDPTAPLAEQELEGEAEEFEEEQEQIEDGQDEEDSENEVAAPVKLLTGKRKSIDALLDRDASMEPGEGMDVAGSASESEEDDDEAATPDEAWDGLSGDSDSEVSESEELRLQHQHELEAEARGVPVETISGSAKPKNKNAEVRKKVAKKRREEAEEKERQKMMLPQKKRKLLNRIEHGTNKRDKEAEILRKKRRKIESVKGK